MGSMNNRLRTSLALRVLLSTILLSSAVIWLSGSILNSRVAADVKQVNLDSSINEARSTIVSARYRLILAKSGSQKEVDELIGEILSAATTVGARASGRARGNSMCDALLSVSTCGKVVGCCEICVVRACTL